MTSLLINREMTMGTFADDNVILGNDLNLVTASKTLQRHLDQIQIWYHKWKIKINETNILK